MKKEKILDWIKHTLKTAGFYIKKWRLIKWAILICLTSFLVLISYLAFLSKTMHVSQLKAGLEQTTIIYDVEGNEAGALFNQKGTFIALHEMSDEIKETVVAIEDKRFYQHNGVDLQGILRVGVGYVLNGFKPVGGGSTLTQQLAKNSFLSQKQTILRKAQEIFLAWEIEKHYKKDDILEMYLNHAYFGNGVWGVEDAALKYFGKHASQLNWSESAILVASLKAPSVYNIIDNYDEAIAQRNIMIETMRQNGVLSEEEYAAALAHEPVVDDQYTTTNRYHYPDYFDAVIDEIETRYGISEDDILNRGYKIYTYLNQDYQQNIDRVYSDDSLFPDAEDGTLIQSATVMIDPKTGGIMALVGGRGDKVFRGFNRVTQMKKQPGSTLKPLAVYTPALEAGYTADSILEDEQRGYGSDQYTPRNWNDEYVGEISLYRALIESKNTSAVWLLDRLGVQTGINKLHQFGIPTTPDDHYLGIALGGMTEGVTPLQLGEAYTAFANQGKKTQTRLVSHIVDASGEIVVDNRRPHQQQIMSPEIAQQMTEMMLDVYSAAGTGDIWLPDGYRIAGKTGTTEQGENDSRDKWMVAYTPDMVVVSWLGFDKVEQGHYIDASSTAMSRLFSRTMSSVLPYSANTPFDAVPQSAQQNQNGNFLGGIVEGLKNVGEQVVEGAKKAGEFVIDRVNDVFNTIKNIFR